MMNWKDSFFHALYITILVYFAHTVSQLIDAIVRMIVK